MDFDHIRTKIYCSTALPGCTQLCTQLCVHTAVEIRKHTDTGLISCTSTPTSIGYRPCVLEYIQVYTHTAVTHGVAPT